MGNFILVLILIIASFVGGYLFSNKITAAKNKVVNKVNDDVNKVKNEINKVTNVVNDVKKL